MVNPEHRIPLFKSLIRRAYRRDPFRYIEKVLKITLTPDQKKAARLLRNGKKRLIVRASHGVGKSVLVAALANWFFDCWPNSITITTAPTAAQVVDVVWREIRKLRKGRRGLLPKAPRMEYNAGWFAVGMTAAKGDAFQGRHSEGGVLIATDESTGVKRDIHDACEGMMIDTEKCFWIHILNPTDSTAYVKELEDSGNFDVMIISALEHPNVLWALNGRQGPIPFPGAVTLEWINERVAAWCQPIQAAHILASDFEWPPGSGFWYRPGPLFEGRVLGIWPSLAFDNVWSDGHWQGCLKAREIDEEQGLEVGCDVARYGDDFTVIFIRRGNAVLEHIRYNGNGITVTRDEIIDLIHRHVKENEGVQGVPIKLDDDGVGGGLTDVLDELGYNVIAINAGTNALWQAHRSRLARR